MIGDTPLIQTSMLKQEGIDQLELQIRDLFLVAMFKTKI